MLLASLMKNGKQIVYSIHVVRNFIIVSAQKSAETQVFADGHVRK